MYMYLKNQILNQHISYILCIEYRGCMERLDETDVNVEGDGAEDEDLIGMRRTQSSAQEGTLAPQQSQQEEDEIVIEDFDD